MAVLYTANTTILPTSDGWTQVSGTAMTTDGVKWISPSAATQIKRANITKVAGVGYKVTVDEKIISTSASYHGLGFLNITKSKWYNVGSRWENVNWITNWSNSTGVNTGVTTSSAGFRFTASIEITPTGDVKYYVNGTLFKTDVGAVSNGDTIALYYNRYTGATKEEIYSVVLEDITGSAPTPNFFPFLVAHS